MSDPYDPFSAGERLAPLRRDPPRKAPPRQPPPGNGGRGPKRPGLLMFIVRFLVFGLYRLVFFGVILGFAVAAAGFVVFSAGLPDPNSLKNYKPPLESRVYADDFELVSELGGAHCVYVPFNQIPPTVSQAFVSAEDRLFWVEPGINPLAILRAGVTDIFRMGSGRRPLGASTITQQVVKNMLLDNNITFGTKIKEALLAMRVSQVMTKQQVITLYLNEVNLGHNSYGIAAAAQTYFDIPLNQLDIAQAATLAALPKAPTNYDPFLHPQASLTRRNFIISRMLADGAITAAQAQAATAEPLLPRAGGGFQGVTDAGYFADAVKTQLIQQFGAAQAAQGGLIVHTSLDPVMQDAATNAVRDGLERYDRAYAGWHGLVAHISDSDLADNWAADLAKQAIPPGMRETWRLGVVLTAGGQNAGIGYVNPDGTPATGLLGLDTMRWARPSVNGQLGDQPDAVSQVLQPGDVIMVSNEVAGLALEQIPQLQAALISLDPKTGRVYAMVGGWSHDISPYNRAIQAQRQPGSSVKPFVYLTAMEQGIQPDIPVLDGPFVVSMPDGSIYRPGNAEDQFEGPVPLFHALEQSLNLATLHLARQIGLTSIAKTFQDFGLVDQMPPYYPSAIGAMDTTLWRMVTGYAELDDYGRQITPTLIDSVASPDGTVLFQAAAQSCDNCVNGDPTQPPVLDVSGAQLADPNSVFQVITMMKGVVQRGTGVPAVVGITQPVAGKTGTTNNNNDVWFIGFTPGLVTGCWVGFDNPKSLGKEEFGGTVCGPIWNQYMKVALKNQPALDFAAPEGMTLQQAAEPDGTMVTEAFKPNQAPGAQNNDALLDGGMADDTGATPTPGAPGTTPAQPSTNIDQALGGSY